MDRALFVDMVTNSDPVLTQFKQHLDGLNTYIEINDLPQEMAQRLRSFMHQQKDALVRDDAMRALPLLSTPLQIEVMLHVHRHWLEEVWFIRNLDDPVKVRARPGARAFHQYFPRLLSDQHTDQPMAPPTCMPARCPA